MVHVLEIFTLFTQGLISFNFITVFLFCKLDYCNAGDGNHIFSTTVKTTTCLFPKKGQLVLFLVKYISEFRNMSKKFKFVTNSPDATLTVMSTRHNIACVELQIFFRFDNGQWRYLSVIQLLLFSAFSTTEFTLCHAQFIRKNHFMLLSCWIHYQ